MLETFLSSVDFRTAGVAADLLKDRDNNLNHTPQAMRAQDPALAVDALPVVALFKAGREGSAASPSEPAVGLPIGGIQKRLLDVVIASAALAILAPLLVLIAIAIKLNMGGPILYSHRRIGFGGAPFDCLKFRSMVACGDEAFKGFLARNPGAADEWRKKRKLENDPRVTRLGRFLRKTSLDELPQFLNVLRGEMSLVGPRPVVSQELEFYGNFVGDYMRARPGVTGLWQVSGRSSLSFDQRVAMDSTYVREWAWSKDLLILVRTVPAIFKTFHTA